MLAITDLDKVKTVAEALLNIKPVINEKYPFIVSHPFIREVVFPKYDENKQMILLDINKEEDLKEIRETYLKDIKRTKKYSDFLILVNKPYLPTFFKFTYELLDENDYNMFLRELWPYVEFPNNDKNISKNEFKKLFKKARQELLMNKDELEVYDNLPNEVTIYRGVSYKRETTGMKALSWTLNKDKAKWFSTRFYEKGIVFTAKINKKEVFAYFNVRNEEEVVIDYNKIELLLTENVEK